MLLVEDNADLREVLAETLEAAGYAVDCATDGRDALEVLSRVPRPNLILLDLWMPRMDGREFLDALHALPELVSVPVILMSGDAVNDVDGVRLVTKPVDIDVLLKVIDEVLHPPSAA